jgi:hypothetical protein
MSWIPTSENNRRQIESQPVFSRIDYLVFISLVELEQPE